MMQSSYPTALSVRLACSLFAAVLLGGCGGDDTRSPATSVEIGGPSGTELAADQTLRIGNGAEPQTLDPHRAEGIPASNVLRDLFEGLVNGAPDGSLVPGVAKRWNVSEDGLIYTFYLRDDARWSNGDSVTAADFVFSLRRSVDPATLSHYSSVLEPIENAAAVVAGEKPVSALGVEALDPLTLVIRLNGPTPYLPGLLTHSSTYPVHRASVEQYGTQFARAGRLIGNGAYKLDEWVVQSHIKLARNESYWDNADTVIETVYYYGIEHQDTELKRYRADELDITEAVPYQQVAWVRKNLGDELMVAPWLGSVYYGFNVTRPPFKDNANLRRAMSLAIDREIITSRITGLGEIPAYNWIPPVTGYTAARPEWANWSQAEREAEARRLYAAAGYSAEQPLTVELHYNTGANNKLIAVALASMWKTILGVKTNLTNQEWKVFLSTRQRGELTQVFRGAWIGDYNDAFTFSQLLYSANEMNHSGYASPRYDALIERSAGESDPAVRADVLQQAEHILLEDMPIIPIYFYVSRHLVKKWVVGREANIMDHHSTKNIHILKH